MAYAIGGIIGFVAGWHAANLMMVPVLKEALAKSEALLAKVRAMRLEMERKGWIERD